MGSFIEDIRKNFHFGAAVRQFMSGGFEDEFTGAQGGVRPGKFL
jgi:hypothetical protein